MRVPTRPTTGSHLVNEDQYRGIAKTYATEAHGYIMRRVLTSYVRGFELCEGGALTVLQGVPPSSFYE